MSDWITISDAAADLRAKRLSVGELVAEALSNAKASQDELHAFVTIDEHGAMAAAAAADEEFAQGKDRGALHGIPIGVKDIIDTAGLRTTCMSRLYADRVPSRDAHVVSQLRAAGAIIIGKLATHEFALGNPLPDLPTFPAARNPWDSRFGPGGSSSGSGPALLSGSVFAAIGTDTGGSIRTPSAFCGVVGMKPSRGLVGRSGIVHLSMSMDACGPITRSVADNAILLEAMAGYDPNDTQSRARPVGKFDSLVGRSITGLRIGVMRDVFERQAPAQEDVRRNLDLACGTFRQLGARVEDCLLPDMLGMEAAFTVIALAESYESHRERLQASGDEYGRSARLRLLLGAPISASDLLRAQRMQERLMVEVASAMESFDIILTAGSLRTAPRLDLPMAGLADVWANRGTANFVNLLGLASLTLPTGLSEGGMPTAMQLIASPGGENKLYQAGAAFEAALSSQFSQKRWRAA